MRNRLSGKFKAGHLLGTLDTNHPWLLTKRRDRKGKRSENFSESLLIFTNMDISKPWTPQLNGNDCAPCALYLDVVGEEMRPSTRSDGPWALKTLEPELSKTPFAREALWEGILALWRLKVEEEAGSNDETWRSLTSAWLVRSCL